MKSLKWCRKFSLGSLFLFFVAFPASAEHIWVVKPMDTTDPKTLLAQTLTIITGVQLQETPDGVEVILETASGEILQGITSVEGNSLIVDLPNAQLQLLEGNEFTQENPIEGIATVNIVAVDENKVRITVTGDEVPPEGEIISTEQGLILSVISPLSEIVIISTAEKRPEDVQNIPISITILTREQIEDADIRSLRDAAALTPNFFTSLGDRSFNFFNF